MRYDVDKLGAILAPGYSLTAVDGDTIGRKVYMASLGLRKLAHNDPKSYKTVIVSLKRHSDLAEVVATETMELRAKDAKTGVVKTIVHRHRYRDTWVRLRGAWLLNKTVTVKEFTDVKLSGK